MEKKRWQALERGAHYPRIHFSLSPVLSLEKKLMADLSSASNRSLFAASITLRNRYLGADTSSVFSLTPVQLVPCRSI